MMAASTVPPRVALWVGERDETRAGSMAVCSVETRAALRARMKAAEWVDLRVVLMACMLAAMMEFQRVVERADSKGRRLVDA